MDLRALLGFLLLPAVAFGADYHEPKPGSAERKAIMEAMRGPVSKYVGKRVTFTGHVRVVGSWASFQGGAEASDGQAPEGDVAFEMELDFFALLRREAGQWKMLHWGFAGDISLAEEAQEKYPRAPKALFPYVVE